MDPDPVGSGFIWVRGSGSGSRGMKSLIKLREKQSLTNKNLFFAGNYIFKSEPKKSKFRVTKIKGLFDMKIKRCFENLVILLTWIRIRIDQIL